MNFIFSVAIFDESFKKGIILFNSNKFNKAHIVWETIWKDGNIEDRKKIKGYIQLTGAIINYLRGKKESSDYLFSKSIKNISANNFKKIINQDKLINDIKLFYTTNDISIVQCENLL